MTYHAPTNQFTMRPDDLRQAALSLKYAIRHIRLSAKLPLGPYKKGRGALSNADHAMKGIIDAAKTLGIDMGADWGDQLDVRDQEDIQQEAKG